MGRPRLVVVGLDSVPPRLAFDLMAETMPFLAALRQSGRWGRLESTDPPVTLPAWATMMTGKDPGELGIYGFRKRLARSYDMALVDARDVRFLRLWETAAAGGLASVAVAVPPSFPPAGGPLSTVVGCFLTPDSNSGWIAPSNKRAELERRFGPFVPDVENFRAADKERILAACEQLTRQRFAIFRHLIETGPCDLAVLVDVGPDRMHHAMLSALLPEHPLHDPRSPLVPACKAYYALLDDELRRTAELLAADGSLLVVSDHGVLPLQGGFCVNEWLLSEGYLFLEELPSAPTALNRCHVDWSRTRAWAEGGHHCRITFNVRGREPHGIVSHRDLEAEQEELAQRIRRVTGEAGEAFDNSVIFPHKRYAQARGLPPDMMVYWDNLSRRAVGTVGHGRVHVSANDTGADEANHSRFGIFTATGAPLLAALPNKPLAISDLHAALLAALGL